MIEFPDTPKFLQRSALLFGENQLARLRHSHVLVLGLGGVGAYAAEMLVRSGVGAITIVDGDVVEESNRNRQLVALVSTVGRAKSEVLKERLLDINPDCRVTAIFEFIRDGKGDELLSGSFDYVVDAIDTLSPKVFFLASCVRKGLRVASSMGSGGRVDPTLIRVGDLAETHGCALARAVRKRLGKMGIEHGITAVYSAEEVPENAVVSSVDDEGKRHSATGTVSYMPAAFGCSLASIVIRALTEPGIARRRWRDGKMTLPLLGFGMMRLPLKPGSAEIDRELAQKLVDRAMAAGVNYFDTAWGYHGGLSESFVGEALARYPRQSYFIASKMPMWCVESEADLSRIFEKQLEKCRTKYFDFYLFHALNADSFNQMESMKAWEFLAGEKANGRIRHLGFSFHDRPEVLEKIVAAHRWDFAQIQLNYLDWDIYRSREQYEILERNHLPCIVMEPLRGGALSNLSAPAREVLHQANPAVSTSSWALRYVASLPNVVTILSGMTLPEQLEDNIATFSSFRPLSDQERAVIMEARAVYLSAGTIPCTSCRYCSCPVGVDIPTVFAIWNHFCLNGRKGDPSHLFDILPECARPDRCIGCGGCMKRCPQGIQIPDQLRMLQNQEKIEETK